MKSICDIVAIQQVCSASYQMFKQQRHEHLHAKKYLEDASVLNSGWDYHWVAACLAGISNQLEKTGKLCSDVACLDKLGNFKFMSVDVLDRYFVHPENCPTFVDHLTSMQQMLDACTPYILARDQ